jgi:hypothetical protein
MELITYNEARCLQFEKSYVNMVLYVFVFIVNAILKNQIQWLDEEDIIKLWHDSKIYVDCH